MPIPERPRRSLLPKTLVLCALMLSGAALGVGTPAGTAISNTAVLDLSDGVTSTTLTSAPVVVNVQQVYAVTITPDGTTAAPGQTVTAQPGTTATLTYTVTNTGNGTDTINLSALTANATAQAGNIAGIYLDNGDGVYGAGDTLVTNLASVPADSVRTVFVRYNVPSGTTGGAASGSAHQLNLTGTSAGDATKTDTNNVGQITVGRTVDLTLTSTQSKTVLVNGSVSFTDTLTNTGNTTLLASELTITVTNTVTNGTGGPIAASTFTTTYSVTGPGGTFSGATLSTLVSSAVGAGLPAGSALTITVTDTPTTTAPFANDKDQIVHAITAYSTASGTGVVNNAPSTDTQGQITNTAVVQRGIGAVTKTVAKCTSSTTCPARTTATTSPVSAKPGEYVVYYLEATNTGTGPLYNIRLKDALPANFVITQVGATTSNAGTLTFSKDGTTWNTAVSSLGTLVGGTNTLYLAVENGGTGTTIDASDTFAASSFLRLKIVGFIRDDVTPQPALTRDDTGL